ncbi:MAG: carboxy terminal-processing peptidase [Deltaproteobacteria bacterium]|nr:carboxy terminal-processing peptidase [Deltaproteobacteria bacterium]
MLTWAAAAEFNRQQAGKIAQAVGRLLEQAHYQQTRLDDSVSRRFLRNYLDALDYNHLVFLQTDVNELEKRFGTTLDDATLIGNAAPAFEIFDRFLLRLDERHSLVKKLLQQRFDFTQDETFLVARNKAPWPRDETEANNLWRLRLKYELMDGRLANERPEETLRTIARRYDRLLDRMLKFDSEEILQTYLSALAQSYDPHSAYMSPTSAANFEISNLKLSLTGIGAVLREEDGTIKVESLIPGGPADLSKLLHPNDQIIAVGQGDERPVDVVGMKLKEVVEMIRGPRHTELRLTIIPVPSVDNSSRKVVRLIRDEFKLTEQKAKARIVDYPEGGSNGGGLGIITLPTFYEKSAADVENLLQRLKKEKIAGLILDLRRNTGGVLKEAIRLTGLFIRQGPVVQVKDSRNGVQILEDNDPKVVYEGPLIVLVGRVSASASEIVAAGLQDYGRAVIVGDQATHGKGTVQTVLSLSQAAGLQQVPDPGKLKLTQAKFYRISGATTQRAGVVPDVVLPSVNDALDLGESSLENSLPADRTGAVAFERSDQVKSHVAALQKTSGDRVAHNAEFADIKEDIDFLKRKRARQHISLNEGERLREKSDEEDRLKIRKEKRTQRRRTHKKIFEMTLEMVDQDKPIAALKQKENDSLAEQPLDVHLEEALDILGDYIKLLGESRPQNSGLVTY